MFPLLRSFKLKIKTKLWQYSSFFLSFNSPQILSNITPFIFHVNFCSLKDTERNRDRGGRTINASHLCIGVGATTEHGLPTSGHTPKEESSLPKKLSAGYIQLFSFRRPHELPSYPCGDLVDLILFMSSVSSHSCCEFMNIRAISYQEYFSSTSQHSSLPFYS